MGPAPLLDEGVGVGTEVDRSPSALYPTLASATAMIHLEMGRQLPSLELRSLDPQGYETTFTFIRMRTSLPATRAPTLRDSGGREVARRSRDRGRPRPGGGPRALGPRAGRSQPSF